MLSYSLRKRKNSPRFVSRESTTVPSSTSALPPNAQKGRTETKNDKPKPPKPWSNMARFQAHREDNPVPMGKKGKKITDEGATQQRQAIALLYNQVYYKTDLPLSGRGGVIPSIAKILCAHPGTVAQVVHECKVVFSHGDEYDASRKSFFRPNQRKIKQGSFLENQIATYKERFSIKTTASIINAMKRMELGDRYNLAEHYVGRKSVTTALQNMNHEKYKVRKVTQASNKNLHWVQARLNFTAQLLVRFGKDLPPDLDITTVQPPHIIDKKMLEAEGLMLSLHQVAWWDEIHIKQRIGEIFDVIYRFARGHDGNYSKTGVVDTKTLVSICF